MCQRHFLCVESSNVNIRRILACVLANECFVSTPPCELPGPWVLGRIERTGPLWFGQADVQAAFYRSSSRLVDRLLSCPSRVREGHNG